MEIETRFLDEKDAVIYRELRLRSYLDDPFSFSESYEDEVKRNENDFTNELKIIGKPEECFVLGMFIEKKGLVGFVKFRRDVRSKARHKAMLHAMYIDPKYRKLGLGKLLINDLMERITKIKGLEQIHLWVLNSGVSASQFYKKCGFESQGMMVKNDLKINDQYVDAEYMVKLLV